MGSLLLRPAYYRGYFNVSLFLGLTIQHNVARDNNKINNNKTLRSALEMDLLILNDLL